ncbi:uncharacterized protein LOC143209553 [Lasioglossum baleicum]|uniref:uncharacterized protein LOC143209553 n=1 Tax=Lasioglossum baleicum TaxID=434251 RepID=UPI003FCC9093
MERVYRGPNLILFRVCLFILLTIHNTDALPHHADGTRDTVQFLRTSEKSANLEATRASVESDLPDSEEWSNNGGEQIRDRRGIVKTLSRTSPRSFIDFRDMQADATIVFPDEDMTPMQRVPVCKGSTYCETVASYPEQTVNEALKRNESLKYLAVVDEVSDIVQRFDTGDDVPLCVSTEQVIYVQAAMNKDNEWKYIANQENFKQGIRVEKCSNENAACSMVNAPGAGYKTSCRQKYAYRQLVAVLPNDTLVLDTFKFPSSCCCHLAFTGGLTPRTGFGAKKTRK